MCTYIIVNALCKQCRSLIINETKVWLDYNFLSCKNKRFNKVEFKVKLRSVKIKIIVIYSCTVHEYLIISKKQKIFVQVNFPLFFVCTWTRRLKKRKIINSLSFYWHPFETTWGIEKEHRIFFRRDSKTIFCRLIFHLTWTHTHSTHRHT